MAYTNVAYIYRRDGVPSVELGGTTTPVGGGVNPDGKFIRTSGSLIIGVDALAGNMYQLDGTTWRQILDSGSTFQDAASTWDLKDYAIGAPAVDSATAVAAREADDVASKTWVGPFTPPDVPRNLTITFENAWAGGDVTVTGTDINDAALTETIADTAGAMVTGSKCFKTVTGVVNQSSGAGGVNHGATIGIGHKYGITPTPAKQNGFVSVNGTTEAAVFDTTNIGVQPTTLPDGSKQFVASFYVTGATSVVTATP